MCYENYTLKTSNSVVALSFNTGLNTTIYFLTQTKFDYGFHLIIVTTKDNMMDAI